MHAPVPTFIDHFAALAPRYDAVLCDVWGVIHNGIAAMPETSDALARFRQQGGHVMLISNAPRPGEWVVRQLDRLSVPRESYDGIVTSGDVSRAFLAGHPGWTIYHLGPERDRTIFDGLPIELGPFERADCVACTGLFDDETEGPEDYREVLERMRARSLFMVCANPDLVVERGERLVYCAGAIADLYRTLGGEVLYAGKPHLPIYHGALDKIAAARGARVPLERVLAIGDSVRTDLRGATALGVDCLFVTAGIHAEELGHRDAPDLEVLSGLFAEAGLTPKAVTRRLTW